MNKHLVFIDDSGDPGFKNTSSDNFVIAAAVFVDTGTAELLMHEIDEYRSLLGWKYNHEFKFARSPKYIVSEMLRRACRYDFNVYAVYIQKSDFRDRSTIHIPFQDSEKLYNWTIGELLQDIPLESAKITIDGRSSKKSMKNMRTYLRREINAGNSGKIDIKFEDSSTTSLLQLADLIAGSINRSLQSEKTDSQEYISIFHNKISSIRKIISR